MIGRGWNQEVWDDPQFPTKEDLDKVAPNNPVALIRTCGHATWANSMALQFFRGWKTCRLCYP
ncbi:amidohydrolase family protein [Sedimentibacter acidaminivorans]|uniref:amidohydrolase family protein n=1 Tax=Sedimentibacter acidaminivorans TaxID=913099 RepID=UPI001AE8E36C